MPTETQLKRGTPIVWSDTTDYNSTVSGLTRTDQIDLTSLAAGAARQGAKVDLGANKHFSYTVLAAVEYASGTAPESGETVEIYFGSSPSSTAGNANPGGLSGSDAAYSGTSGDSLADSLLQLTGPFVFVLTADASTTVQYKVLGVLQGDEIDRYVMPVVFNNADTEAFVADAVEMYVALVPQIPESQ